MITEQFGFLLLLGGLLFCGLLAGLILYPLLRLRKKQPVRAGVLLPLFVLLLGSGGLSYYCAKNWKNAERIRPEGTTREWAEPVFASHAPGNFFRVSPELYRSAQPTPEEMKALEKLGIRSSINLRSMHSDRDEVAGVGIREIRIKSVATDIETGEVVAFLQAVRDPANLPALVHCQHGSDRTGTMCAFYRIIAQDWSKEDAIAELTSGGYGFHYIYDRRIVNFIRSADLARLRELSGWPAVPAGSAQSGTKGN